MYPQRGMLLIRIQQFKRLYESPLVGFREPAECLKELRGEAKGAKGVDVLPPSATARVPSTLEVTRPQFVHASGTDVGQGALQGGEGGGAIGPPVLAGDDFCTTKPHGVVLDADLELAAFTDSEAAADIYRQSDAALTVHCNQSSRHNGMTLVT